MNHPTHRHSRTTTVLASALLALALSLGGAGCAPTLEVVRTAPEALPRQAEYVVLPVSFEGLTVDGRPETAWLSPRREKSQRSWAADKGALGARFAERVKVLTSRGGVTSYGDGARPAQVVIRTNVVAVSDAGQHVDAVVEVLRDGQVVDELRVRGKGDAYWIPTGRYGQGFMLHGWSIGEHVRAAADSLGEQVAAYLRARTG